MKNFWKTACILLALLVLAQGTDHKLYVSYQGEAGEDGMFWFAQDLETGTRCYAFRHVGNEGVAMSCVPTNDVKIHVKGE
jgi:hypothetical protein